MKHISLYRKWRPQSFDQVIGQRHVTDTLENAFRSERVVHAYLFCGPRGTGKTSTARILAKAVNCAEGPTPQPCNKCEACKEISAGTSLDVIEIDAASNRGIDEIRDLRDKIVYAPTSFRSKVYVIDEVHMLTTEASNALLKMLEEPPGGVIFVLATTEPNRVLPTIVSRCQRFDFWPVPADAIAKHLARIASEESVEIEEEALNVIAEYARGSVRDAIGVLDQMSSMGEGGINAGDLAVLLGTVEAEMVFEAASLLIEKNTAGLLALVQVVESEGKDQRRFVAALVECLHGIFLIQNSKNPREVVVATEEHYLKMEEIAREMQRHTVIRLMELLGETYREMRWADNPRLLLEVALVKATRPSADMTLESLEFRLSELERSGLGEGESEKGKKDRKPTKKTSEKPARMGAEGGERPKRDQAKDEGEKKNTPDARRGEPVAKAGKRPSEKRAMGNTITSLERAKHAWPAVLSKLKKEKISTHAFLMNARLVDLQGKTLTLEFPPRASFQKSLLMDEGEQAPLKAALRDVLGEDLEIEVTSPGGQKGTDRSPTRSDRRPERSGKETKKRNEGGGDELEDEKKSEERSGDSLTGEQVIAMVKEGLDGEILE